MATVRRPTGGRAVWHSREVTYAVAAPAETFGSLQQTYQEIHAMIAAALRDLGACVAPRGPAAGGRRGRRRVLRECGGGEVMAPDGRKVVGSAQVRAGRGLSPARLHSARGRAGRGRGESPWATPARPSAAGLADLVDDRRATRDVVSDAVVRSASSRWGTPGTPGSLPDGVARRAETLRGRFADETWTWRR